jgi:hypothetical protein
MQLVEVGELVMLEQYDVPPSESQPSSLSDLDFEKLSVDSGSRSTESSMASVMREDSFGSTKSSRRSSLARALSTKKSGKHSRNASPDNSKTNQNEAMSRWLSHGNVIYKSVGLGLMDLVVGGDLVRLARQKGIGTTIQDF